MALYSISPLDVIVTLDNHVVIGYAEGTFIQLTKEEDIYRIRRTADGCISRTRIESKVWTLDLTLAQSSPSNDMLTQLHLADIRGGGAKFPITIKDALGSTLFSDKQAWIQRLPDVTFSNAVETRVWRIYLPYASFNVGGNSYSPETSLQQETVYGLVNGGL